MEGAHAVVERLKGVRDRRGRRVAGPQALCGGRGVWEGGFRRLGGRVSGWGAGRGCSECPHEPHFAHRTANRPTRLAIAMNPSKSSMA